MTVSAVITCFNLEAYVGTAIDSAKAALAGIDAEIILVDDCSTDGSAEAIQRQDVRYLRTERNSGVMLATLAGIAVARHPVIAFLDGDDLWYENKLRAVLEVFAADERVALVTHDLDFVDSAGRRIERRSRPSQTMPQMPASQCSSHLRRSIMEHRDDVWLGSALSVHRDRAGLDAFCEWVKARPDSAELYQDWPLAAWIAARSECHLAYIPEKLFAYRLHGSNHSGDAGNASRALRNFQRNRNTLRAMVEIISKQDGPSPKLLRDLALAEAQAALYAGRTGEALRFYGAALPALARRPGTLAKEAARIAAIGLLGRESGQKLLRRAQHA